MSDSVMIASRRHPCFLRRFLSLIVGAVFASGRLTAGTEAGDGHVQVGAGGGEVQALADEGGFHSFAAAVETVEQAAQGFCHPSRQGWVAG